MDKLIYLTRVGKAQSHFKKLVLSWVKQLPKKTQKVGNQTQAFNKASTYMTRHQRPGKPNHLNLLQSHLQQTFLCKALCTNTFVSVINTKADKNSAKWMDAVRVIIPETISNANMSQPVSIGKCLRFSYWMVWFRMEVNLP